MARTHARIYTSIWADDDFRRLTKDGQRLYVLLITQPQITNCGVLPYVPKKWARLARDETSHALILALSALIDHRFIVVDEHTDELLIRTYVKHDRIVNIPQLAAAAQREFAEIESRAIRETLLAEYPDLFHDVATPDDLEPSPDPLFDLSADESPDESTDASSDQSADVSLARVGRAHTRAPTPTPAPTPNPLATEDPELYVAREAQPEPSLDDDHEPAANSTGLAIPTDVLRNIP